MRQLWFSLFQTSYKFDRGGERDREMGRGMGSEPTERERGTARCTQTEMGRERRCRGRGDEDRDWEREGDGERERTERERGTKTWRRAFYLAVTVDSSQRWRRKIAMVTRDGGRSSIVQAPALGFFLAIEGEKRSRDFGFYIASKDFPVREGGESK